MRLFISYARVDKPLCRQVVHHLEGAHEVWYDQRLHAGQAWWDEILEHLDWSEGFVYLLSPESVESQYCQKEFAIAAEAGKHIFPVLIQVQTPIPASLGHIHYADLSEGMEDIITLMNALTVAERHQRSTPAPRPALSQSPSSEVSPTTALSQAADALEAENFDNAVFICKEALAKQPTGRVARILENLLNEAETELERQAYLREAEREYVPIQELMRRKVTRSLGCKEFQDFRQQFPDYDPDDFASICTDLTALTSDFNEEIPDWLLETTPNVNKAALQQAQNFAGKHNIDWQPYITTFPDLPIPDMPFCLVPVGTFNMGSADGYYAGEEPIHQQTIDQPYWIAKYPVTNAQWKLAVDAGAVKPPHDTGKALEWYNDSIMADVPVVGVDWFMARDFATWMGCHLPTELEWEYAARGVESLRYPWGNEWKSKIPIWYENSGGKPSVVTTKPEDQSWVAAEQLIGNVWEWTGSFFGFYPYQIRNAQKSTGSSTNFHHVVRGGSWWDYNNHFLRAAYRFSEDSDSSDHFRGFRLARSVS